MASGVRKVYCTVVRMWGSHFCLIYVVLSPPPRENARFRWEVRRLDLHLHYLATASRLDLVSILEKSSLSSFSLTTSFPSCHIKLSRRGDLRREDQSTSKCLKLYVTDLDLEHIRRSCLRAMIWKVLANTKILFFVPRIFFVLHCPTSSRTFNLGKG